MKTDFYKNKFLGSKFSGIILGLILCISVNAQTWNVITTATASDASASSYFGSDVVTEGDYSIVRAAGSIYVFKRDVNVGTWSQKQKISFTGSYNYGSGSISLSGDYIAVIGGASVSTGSLYIFKRDASTDTWVQQQILHPSDATGFSGAVSISGNFIVAGASSESEDVSGSNPLTNSGAAYIYEKISGTWSEQQKIVSSNRVANSYFGSSVSISRDNIVVGASGYLNNTVISDYKVGGVYNYKRNSTTDIWDIQGVVFTGTAPKSYTNNLTTNVGSVAISNKYIIVGSYTNFWDYWTRNGLVSIYEKNSAGTWVLIDTIILTNANNGIHGSYNYTINSVSISNDYFVINYTNLVSYLFKRNTLGTWSGLQSFAAGTSVNVSGEDVAIGNSAITSNTGNVNYLRRAPYATLLKTATSIGSTQGSKASAGLIYNTPFTATSNQSWLTVSPTGVTPVNISDTVVLNLTASVNTTTSPRTAKVTIAATGVSNQYVVVTQKAVPTITWSYPADISYGTALSKTQLNATANTEGNFTYTPSLETVLNTGTAQTLKVDFVPKDTASYEPTTKIVQINVVKAIPIITWTNPADITYGAVLNGSQLNATSDVVGTYTYNPASGTKLNAGLGQTLSVNFTPIDAINFESVTKTAQINVKKATPVITWVKPADIIYGTALSSTQLNATANVSGTFTYSPAVGTTLNAAVAQTLQVTFTPTDNTNYETTTKTVQLNVNKKDPVVTWATPADIVYGTALSLTQLNASADQSGVFTYTPAIGTKLNAGSLQSLQVTFVPTDATNNSTITKTVYINVTQATPVLTWGTPADITYGTTLSATQLNASANIVGAVSYTPAIGTKLNAGSNQVLTVIFAPTDAINYAPVYKSVFINVKKATPTLTWYNPADIVYGTTLSSTQLNATTSVSGTFTYTPGYSIPNVGTGQILSVVFSPTDAINYETVNKSVLINVISGTLSTDSPTTLNLSAQASNSKTINITSNTSWSTSTDQSWLTTTPANSKNGGTVTLIATANSGAERSATLTVKSLYSSDLITIKVVQAAGNTAVESLQDEKLILYPNPTQKEFKVTGLIGSANVYIYDIQGRQLITRTIVDNEAISVESLVKGLYVVKISNSEGTFETKLMKK